MKCPRCGALEFTTVRMYNEIGKTFKNVCSNCGCVYPVIEGPKPKFHQRLWTYTKFLFGVGWFGGRTYVMKNYGMDIGPKPEVFQIKSLEKPVEPHFSHRTPEEHDENIC